jgi:hypothetical protein
MAFQGASFVRLAQRQAGQSFSHSVSLLFNLCSYGASGVWSFDKGGVVFGPAIVTSGAGDEWRGRALCDARRGPLFLARGRADLPNNIMLSAGHRSSLTFPKPRHLCA